MYNIRIVATKEAAVTAVKSQELIAKIADATDQSQWSDNADQMILAINKASTNGVILSVNADNTKESTRFQFSVSPQDILM